MKFVVGIDLGGTCIKWVAVTPEGETLSREQVDFDAAEPQQWATRIRELILRRETEHGSAPVRIGLSAPGLAAADNRSIAHMPGRLHGLEGFDWTSFLEAPAPVPVLNDAHAALVGEAWLGAARAYRHVILLTLGTGVGGAAMADGRLLQGTIGRAGHFGHAGFDLDGPPDICGMPGSLEVAIGNCTIHERSAGRFATTHALIAAYRAGDAFAAEVWLKSVKTLALAVASFVNILDPEAVIVGGGIARAGEALFMPLQKYLDAVEWRPGGHRVPVVPAQLGEFAGAYGAAKQALQTEPQ